MARFDFLPSYHYEVNTDGIINKPADKLLRKCTICGAEGGVGDLNDSGKYVIPITVSSNLVDMSKITGGRQGGTYGLNAAITARCKVIDGVITISYGLYADNAVYYDTKMTVPSGQYTISADCYIDMDNETYNQIGFGVRRYYSDGTSKYSGSYKYMNLSLQQWERASHSFTLDESEYIAIFVQPVGDKDNYLNIPLKVKNIQLISEADSKTMYIELDKPLGEGERIDISGIYVPNERNIITIDTAVQPSAVEYQYYTY